MTLTAPGSSSKVNRSSKVNLLPDDMGSLAYGLPPAAPGTLFVRGAKGGMSVAPDADFDLIFGRCEPDVHVCVGVDDTHVSRRHGFITREGAHWVLHNVGRLPIRLPGAQLVLGGHRTELPVGYVPLFIVAPKQEHLLEVRVAAGASHGGKDVCEADTSDPKGWPLSPEEHLVLVCLSQRYLRGEPHPQPLTWAQVADELSRLRPGERWNWRKAARIVTEVRKRLSGHVFGLLEEEVPPPIGNTLNHNLIMELLMTATLVESDLLLLEESDTLRAT